MSITYITAALRRQVVDRAEGCCEYCRMTHLVSWMPYAVDHIRSEKHGGATTADNLCFACFRCNSFKGSDIAGEDPLTKLASFLFHPRQQSWDDHFRLNGAVIEPLTPEGRVTVNLLRINDSERVAEREVALQLGLFPCAGAT
jgi:hypothetical protein